VARSVVDGIRDETNFINRWEKINVDSYLKLSTKKDSRWVIGLNEKVKIKIKKIGTHEEGKEIVGHRVHYT
jgi:hypothetical protein